MRRYSYGYLAIPGVLSLIFFLAFSSQWLFSRMEPGPLSRREAITFNALIIVLGICYARAVLSDPGHIPPDWKPEEGAGSSRQRWCRKCDAFKPPRAHHCKICKRCIPKMDHHCPWTVNCVSHITYPHFLRFVGYADLAIIYLEYFLYVRAAIVWEDRDMPSYHGPSVMQLAHLFILIALNSLTLFALGILFIRAVWCLVVNTYTIEGWEIERHETLLRRSRVLGGYLDGLDGTRVRIVRQEFPYDIGFWNNIVQGMGTYNILAWFWPFAASPSIQSGIEYETNGFEDSSIGWPPPDPDRMPRSTAKFNPTAHANAAAAHTSGFSPDEIMAFRQRQDIDVQRMQQQNDNAIRRRQTFHQRFDTSNNDKISQIAESEPGADDEGEEFWRNAEGESLADFGVDQEAEFYDEEDMPLSELIKRKKAARAGI